MQTDELNQRLSRIHTMWTQLHQAHGGGVGAAQWAVLERYQRAIYRYLLGAVRDADVAEELSQEFALRFLRGDFRRANPERGRFRDYLKTSLVHLVTDYHRARQAAPGPLAPDIADPAAVSLALEENDKSFVANWRTELLDRTWQALREFNPTYHAALQLRIENPEMPSSEMATLLTTRLSKEVEKIVMLPGIQEKMVDLGVEPKYLDAKQLTDFIVVESAMWGNLIKEAGISAK